MKMVARLILLAVVGWLTADSSAQTATSAVCPKCGKAGDNIPMADACTTCRDAWDWGPTYWHWGYSAGVWEAPSGKWPGAPYFQPALKHLCADCKGVPKT